MQGDAPVSWLMFFTLGAGVVIAGGLFLSFLRSRHNREIAANAIGGDGHSRGIEPSGVGAELLGILAVALVAMALLAVGYRSRSYATVAETPSTSVATNNQLHTDRTDPNAPKPYQPSNPAPDTRAAPTSSSTGISGDSGGRPEQQPKQ